MKTRKKYLTHGAREWDGRNAGVCVGGDQLGGLNHDWCIACVRVRM